MYDAVMTKSGNEDLPVFNCNLHEMVNTPLLKSAIFARTWFMLELWLSTIILRKVVSYFWGFLRVKACMQFSGTWGEKI